MFDGNRCVVYNGWGGEYATLHANCIFTGINPLIQFIDEEKSVKSEERCGLAWSKDISFNWGAYRTACIPFKDQSDNFNNDFSSGTCFHTDVNNLPPEGPVWKLNFPEAMKITKV